MKLQLPLLATLLTLSTSSPITQPDAEPATSPRNPVHNARKHLEQRADTWCKVKYSPPTDGIVCMLNPDINSKYIRTVHTSDNFGVRCKEPGWDTNPYWSYIPGWNCYVVTKWTTCQSVPVCFCDVC